MGLNLALNKTATQSVISFGGGVDRAVDGNQDSNFKGNSVTATGIEQNPWWRVDLGAVHSVANVLIFNRRDCCLERLRDFHMELFNEDKSVGSYVHQTFKSGMADPLTFFHFPHGSKGRFVQITLESNDILSLAEVEVYPPSRYHKVYDCLRSNK